MQNKAALVQAKICFCLILANFLAQIPYFFHLYFDRQDLGTDLRSFAIMGAVFAAFISAMVLLHKRHPAGYWLTVVFLSSEFLFYLWNTVGSVIHGRGLFFQVTNPDLTLRVVYSIGYTNFFASGYFLGLLIFKRDTFLKV